MRHCRASNPTLSLDLALNPLPNLNLHLTLAPLAQVTSWGRAERHPSDTRVQAGSTPAGWTDSLVEQRSARHFDMVEIAGSNPAETTQSGLENEMGRNQLRPLLFPHRFSPSAPATKMPN